MNSVKPLRRAAGTGIAITATAALGLYVYTGGHHHAAPRPVIVTSGVTCWAQGTGITIRTVGYPGACLTPGQWQGPVSGAPYLPVQAHAVHWLGIPICTADDSGTVWTVWSSGDLLGAEDVCGDLGGTPPGEAP